MRQEVRPLHVDVHQAIEAFLAGFQNVRADVRSDAGIVHQQVQPSEGRAREVDELGAVGGDADVCLTDFGVDGFPADLGLCHAIGGGLVGGFFVAGVIHYEIKTKFREFERDAASDAAGSAGDESHLIHAGTLGVFAVRQKQKLVDALPACDGWRGLRMLRQCDTLKFR